MITFLGGIIPNEDSEWFSQNCRATIPISSDTHQKSIIQGLRSQTETEVLYMSPSGFFPSRFKKAFVLGKRIDEYTKRIESSNVPLIRIPYNINSQYKALKESIVNGSKAIVCYMPFYHRMKAIANIKKDYPNVPIIIIVPDLVEHSYSPKGIGIRRQIVKTLRKIEAKEIDRLSSNIDGYVYLAEQMKYKIGKGKPYIVQEAIYNKNFSDNITETQSDNSRFIFTYCGKLAKLNGIERLVEAFMKINNSDTELWLCGDGELLEYVKQKSKEDQRIKVLGQISHDEVMKIEKNSTVLVNPRYTSIENAAYSFPSKLIEYLACGKPVISSHLAGIPREYDEYVFYIKDDSADALKQVMEDVLSYTEEELENIGFRNAQFVENEKASAPQGKKMFTFIQELIENANATHN